MHSPFPPNAKRVFQGKIFDVYQWEQKLFDGTTATFEKLHRVNTSEAIAVVGDKFMLQRQTQPHMKEEFICFPGGMCHTFDEDPLVAAKRELLEESGFVSNDWVVLGKHTPFSKIAWTIYTHIARDCVETQKPHLDSGEKIETFLVSFDELLDIVEQPNFRNQHHVPAFLKMRIYPDRKKEFLSLAFGK
ncbi:MAG: NUDIX hydrolase [Candidatus Pacebacteria bacterium]|nr:NUDIX hydrolase [Candidatus Paceibacterota bacterium]